MTAATRARGCMVVTGPAGATLAEAALRAARPAAVVTFTPPPRRRNLSPAGGRLETAIVLMASRMADARVDAQQAADTLCTLRGGRLTAADLAADPAHEKFLRRAIRRQDAMRRLIYALADRGRS